MAERQLVRNELSEGDGAARQPQEAQELGVDLDRDKFMRSLIRELSGILEEVVGLEVASGLIDVVGQALGERIDHEYRRALGLETLSRPQVARVLVDLEQRIGGDFFVIEADDEKIVLGNRRCPFGDDPVASRPPLCRMTSNIFGTIAAENLGYGKVELQETIARGHPGCRVVVHLEPTPEAQDVEGREYFETG